VTKEGTGVASVGARVTGSSEGGGDGVNVGGETGLSAGVRVGVVVGGGEVGVAVTSGQTALFGAPSALCSALKIICEHK
jgi:hypothetical protein